MPSAAHACGQDHAQVLFERWMSHDSFAEIAK